MARISDTCGRARMSVAGLAVVTSWPSYFIESAAIERDWQFAFASPDGSEESAEEFGGGSLVVGLPCRVGWLRDQGVTGVLSVSTFGSRALHFLTGVETVDETTAVAGRLHEAERMFELAVPRSAAPSELGGLVQNSAMPSDLLGLPVAVGTGDSLAACVLAKELGHTGCLVELGSTALVMDLDSDIGFSVVGSIPELRTSMLGAMADGKQDTHGLESLLSRDLEDLTPEKADWPPIMAKVVDGVVRLDMPALEFPDDFFLESVEQRLARLVAHVAKWVRDTVGERDMIISGGAANAAMVRRGFAREMSSPLVWMPDGAARGAALLAAKAAGEDDLIRAVLSSARRAEGAA